MGDVDFRQKAWSAGLIVLFFVGWELFCLVTGMSDLVLPRPSQVFVTLFEKFPILWPHILQTLAAEGRARAFGDTAEWNKAQLSSFKMTPFRRLGLARCFTVLGHTLVFWCAKEPSEQIRPDRERRNAAPTTARLYGQ